MRTAHSRTSLPRRARRVMNAGRPVLAGSVRIPVLACILLAVGSANAQNRPGSAYELPPIAGEESTGSLPFEPHSRVAQARGSGAPAPHPSLRLSGEEELRLLREAGGRPRTLPVRKLKAYPFSLGSGRGVAGVETSVGRVRTFTVKPGQTFFDIARETGLGYNEFLSANPGLDPWLPPVGEPILVPSEWLLPHGRHSGLVLNIPEMRMYYYPKPGRGGQATVMTFPVGLGRQDWQTPQGEFRIRGKTKNPTWVIPESIRKERLEEDGLTDTAIAGGHPDNPLGTHRLELTLPSYAIHGTNKNWGIGMQVSHGCVRMYPEDISAFFPVADVGARGVFVYQPVKMGVSNGRVLVEVHEDIYSVAPWSWKLANDLIEDMGVAEYVDPELLEAALDAASGIPTDIGYVSAPTEASLP